MAGGYRPHAGRKRTPPTLEELRNNPTKRRIVPNVVQPNEFGGGAPPWLPGRAVEFWRDNAEVYRRLGLLTELSVPFFAMLCDAWGEYLELREDINTNGRTHVTHNVGTIARPEVAMLKAAFERFRVSAMEFGLGPASLSRITAAGASGEGDPVAEYRAKRRGAA